MPDSTVLADLLGGESDGFRGSKWSEDRAVFRSNPKLFQRLSTLDVLRDPEQWLDRATALLSFPNLNALARSEARRRYFDGESIYIFGLDRTVKPLRGRTGFSLDGISILKDLKLPRGSLPGALVVF
jgi:hypothetical protein